MAVIAAHSVIVYLLWRQIKQIDGLGFDVAVALEVLEDDPRRVIAQ